MFVVAKYRCSFDQLWESSYYQPGEGWNERHSTAKTFFTQEQAERAMRELGVTNFEVVPYQPGREC